MSEYEVKLADGHKIQTTEIELKDRGISFPVPNTNKVRFVPYEALLWIDQTD